jgi:hypothetical protein
MRGGGHLAVRHQGPFRAPKETQQTALKNTAAAVSAGLTAAPRTAYAGPHATALARRRTRGYSVAWLIHRGSVCSYYSVAART